MDAEPDHIWKPEWAGPLQGKARPLRPLRDPSLPKRGRGRPRGYSQPWLAFDPPLSKSTWYRHGRPIGIPVECIHLVSGLPVKVTHVPITKGNP